MKNESLLRWRGIYCGIPFELRVSPETPFLLQLYIIGKYPEQTKLHYLKKIIEYLKSEGFEWLETTELFKVENGPK